MIVGQLKQADGARQLADHHPAVRPLPGGHKSLSNDCWNACGRSARI